VCYGRPLTNPIPGDFATIEALSRHRKRVGYPELRRAVLEQARAFDAKTILIEDKASGTPLIQDLIGDGVHGVQRYEPTMDKVMRMHSVTSTIENGFVHLPDQAAWLGEYLHELATFPNAKYDDQADSTSQALDWFKQHNARDWFVDMGKRELARAEAEQSATFERPITRGELLGRGARSAAAQNRSESKKADGKHGSEEAPGPVTYYPDGRDKKKNPEGSGPVTWRPKETEED
jgi:predicted phage terminase large subunit-like protein